MNFCYRYVTGADQELVVAIDAVRHKIGRLGVRAMENIRREIYGGAGQRTLGRLLEDTRRQIEAGSRPIGQDRGRQYAQLSRNAGRRTQQARRLVNGRAVKRAMLTEMR